VTISEAEAVLEIDEHHHGYRGGDRAAGGEERVRRLGAPAGGDDRSLAMKMLAISCASATRPPPFVAQVEHDPARAGAQLAFDGLAHFAVGAG